MKIKISIPNDFGSDHDYASALAECYAGDDEACANDSGARMYEALAIVAKGAGLTFVRETDFGDDWEGTESQVAQAEKVLPCWAGVHHFE